MDAQQFFVQLLSDYALLSVFAQCSTPKDLHCLTVSYRDLQEAVKRGATSAFYDLTFNGKCSRAEPQAKQAQTWLGRTIVHAWNSQCGDTTERCSMCPNHICTKCRVLKPYIRKSSTDPVAQTWWSFFKPTRAYYWTENIREPRENLPGHQVYIDHRLRRCCAKCEPEQLEAWRHRHNREWVAKQEYHECRCVEDFKKAPSNIYGIKHVICYCCLGAIVAADARFRKYGKEVPSKAFGLRQPKRRAIMEWQLCCPCGEVIEEDAIVFCGWCDGLAKEWSFYDAEG